MGFCFVLAKKLTEGKAKKVEVHEKKSRVKGLLTYFFFYIPLIKDSPSFYEQNETTIISKNMSNVISTISSRAF